MIIIITTCLDPVWKPVTFWAAAPSEAAARAPPGRRGHSNHGDFKGPPVRASLIISLYVLI